MQNKHSQTPWTISNNPTWSHCIYTKDGCIAQGNDPLSNIKNNDTATANAQFIVKAVNAHDELVDTLKESLDILINEMPKIGNNYLTIEKIEKILEKIGE